MEFGNYNHSTFMLRVVKAIEYQYSFHAVFHRCDNTTRLVSRRHQVPTILFTTDFYTPTVVTNLSRRLIESKSKMARSLYNSRQP